MPAVFVTDEMAHTAAKLLDDIQRGRPPTNDAKMLFQMQLAADKLLRFKATQERYGLQPQTPADYQRALVPRTRNPTNAQQLETLTPEALADLQRQLTADYPQKPS